MHLWAALGQGLGSGMTSIADLAPLSLACRILCGACGLWRIIAYEAVLAVRDDAEWTCAQLRCDTSFEQRAVDRSHGRHAS